MHSTTLESPTHGRPAFLTAEWRYLVMLNFRVDPGLLQRHVPRGTVLDTHDGATWLSLVGFRFLRTRLLGVPVPGHRDFPEVNLRFYVRSGAGARRAVVFLREIVPRRAIALTARALYNEPYVTRPMQALAPRAASVAPGHVSYAWRRGGRWNRIGATAEGPPEPIRDGSDEEFIAEHYWGYTAQRDGGTLEYSVAHPRWRAWRVAATEYDVDVAGEYGPALAAAMRDGPAGTFLAEGSAIRVGWPRRLRADGSG